jgi:hypothetical protein
MQKLISINDEEIAFPIENVDKSDIQMAEIFKCTSCSQLVLNPRYCNCQDIYCKKCTFKCNICPKNYLPQDLGKIESNILLKIKIKCILHGKGCSDVIEMGRHKEHLEKYCNRNYKCNNCNLISDYKNMILHIRNCVSKKENRKKELTLLTIEDINCDSTDVSKPEKKKKKSHFKHLISSPKFNYFEDVKNFYQKSKCINCDTFVPTDQRKAHYLLCPKYKIKCHECSTIIQKKNFPFHNDGNCFMKMVLFYESNRKAGIYLERKETQDIIKIENLRSNLTEKLSNESDQIFLNRKRMKERESRRNYNIEFDKQSDFEIEGQNNEVKERMNESSVFNEI